MLLHHCPLAWLGQICKAMRTHVVTLRNGGDEIRISIKISIHIEAVRPVAEACFAEGSIVPTRIVLDIRSFSAIL
jgi:hypothetical protein